MSDAGLLGDVEPGTVVRAAAGVVPVTVLAIAAASWVLAAAEVRFGDVFGPHPLNPLVYLLNMLFHSDWGHFAGNVRLWLPLGAVFTWLTGDRHVLTVVVTSQVLASVVSSALLQFGAGLSVAVFAVAAAALVRATGIALQEASTETLQVAVTGVFVPPLVGFLLVALLLGGPGGVGHFDHFLGFLFGGATEALYVLSAYGESEPDRSVPNRVTR